MRMVRKAMVLAGALVGLCAALAAQTIRPINLFSLEVNGGGAPPLHVFRVNSVTGALLEVPNSPFATGLGSNWVVVDPAGRFVYVSNSSSNDISAYSVDFSTGTLTRIPGSPFTTGVNPGVMGIDPTGRFLYVSSINSSSNQSNLYGYSIDSGTGVLTAVAGSPFVQSNIINSITFDPKGNFVFLAPAQQNPFVTVIDSVDFTTGAPLQVGSGLSSKSPAQLTAVEPNGRFLYTTDVSLVPSTVDAFAFNPAQATLTEIQGSPFVAAPIIGAFDFAFDPLGKVLYLVSSNFAYQTTNPPSDYDGNISAFLIDAATGALTTVGGSPFAAGINPLSIVVDPTGHFAYATSTTYTAGTNISFATILSYSIDASTGGLSPLTNPPWTDTLSFSSGKRLAISYGPTGTPNPAPMLSSLSPSSVTAGSAGFTLQANGLNFVPGSTVYFGGKARNTTFVSATQLNADILNGDIANGGTGVVFVFNPLPGGGASGSVEFTVFNPAPTILSINPTTAVAGGTGFILAVNGSNFVTGSIVNFNGTARTTTYISAAKLTIAISTSDIANQGTANITVTNPANGVAGGGTSDPLPLTILPATIQPTIGTLVPASATAGDPAFTLTVIGTGFTSASVVGFNLNNVKTAYFSSTKLQAEIPASAIALAGSPVVTVTNPGVGIPFVATFVVNNPQPGGGAVFPPSLPAGGAALTLNVTGMNFTKESTVQINGSPRVTTFINSTSLQATLLSSDLSRGGTLNITVSNPPPGGGTTPAIRFTVVDYSVTAPAAPISVPAGQPASLSLTVASSNGIFSNPVTFTASGLPPGTTATFSPSATITPGSNPTDVTLSITTMARSFAAPKDSPREPLQGWPSLYLIVAAFSVIALALRISTTRTQRLAPQFLLVLLLLMAAGLVACGAVGSGTSPSPQGHPGTGTPAGTYAILVTATSGSVVHATTVTLTVQ